MSAHNGRISDVVVLVARLSLSLLDRDSVEWMLGLIYTTWSVLFNRIIRSSSSSSEREGDDIDDKDEATVRLPKKNILTE